MGNDSQRAVQYLHKMGFTSAKDIIRGLEGQARDVDPNLSMYQRIFFIVSLPNNVYLISLTDFILAFAVLYFLMYEQMKVIMSSIGYKFVFIQLPVVFHNEVFNWYQTSNENMAFTSLNTTSTTLIQTCLKQAALGSESTSTVICSYRKGKTMSSL